MPADLENSAVATGLEKVRFHSNPKGNAKECSNYHTVALISHSCKVMLKILQARLQQSWTKNFQIFKLNLEKAEEPDPMPVPIGSYKKQKNFRKTSTSASLTMLKPLTVWITTNCGKFLKRWEYQTILPTSLFFTISLSLLKLRSIKSVMPSNHLVLFHPLLLLPSIFLRIRVFSNESVFIRWLQLQHQSFQWIFRTDLF